MASPKKFFSKEEQTGILDAIAEAERITSGEIRVHVDLRAGDDLMGRAQEVFDDLGMSETKLRNGVLLYLAIEEGKFAVIGDIGINERVPDDFWDNIRDAVQESFREGDFLDGTLYFIEEAGEHLQEYFPHEEEDTNELPDAISFGESDSEEDDEEDVEEEEEEIEEIEMEDEEMEIDAEMEFSSEPVEEEEESW